MEKLSVFGSTGFIGNRFCEMFPSSIERIERNCVVPATNNILYLISTTHNYWVFEDLLRDINTNLVHLMKVLENCKDKGDLVFNFISSWFVYGDIEMPVSEDSLCNPKGTYSITKRCAEQLLINFCNVFGIKYRILRLCGVFGHGDKFSKKKNALQYIFQQMINGEDIQLYNGGYFTRNYMHVDDVCNAISTCVENAGFNEIINIGYTKSVVFKDMIDFVTKELDYKGKISGVLPPDFHKCVQTKDFSMSVKKLYSLGFEPDFGLFERIKETIDGMVKNGKI